MKRIILTLVITLLITSFSVAQRYGPLDTEILYAHLDYEKALVKGDVEKLRDVTLADHISGRVRIESLDRDYERTRGYGDSGIVSVIWTIKGRNAGTPFNSKVRASIFYVKRDERWRIVAEHLTTIKEDPPPAGLEDSLISLERSAWQAWKTRDLKFFGSYIDGHGSIADPKNAAARASVFKDITCHVKSYSLDEFTLKIHGEGKATLNYKARQDAVCGRTALPRAVSAVTLYVRRGDVWVGELP